MGLHLPVLLGTVREGSATRHVARWLHARLAGRAGVTTRLLDPAELPFGDLVAREWEMEPRPPAVAAFVDEIARADGFVLVFPEYNHGYPGALKNVLDAAYDEWNHKPFALASTGGVSGGLRAAEQVRLVVLALRGHPLARQLQVPSVRKAFAAEGPLDAHEWERRADALFEALELEAGVLREARARLAPS